MLCSLQVYPRKRFIIKGRKQRREIKLKFTASRNLFSPLKTSYPLFCFVYPLSRCLCQVSLDRIRLFLLAPISKKYYDSFRLRFPKPSQKLSILSRYFFFADCRFGGGTFTKQRVKSTRAGIVQFRIRCDRWLKALKTSLHRVSLDLK